MRAGGPQNKLSEEHAQLIFDFFDQHTVEMPDSKGEAVWSNPEINTQGAAWRAFRDQNPTLRVSESTMKRYKKKWLQKNDLRRIVRVKPDHNW